MKIRALIAWVSIGISITTVHAQGTYYDSAFGLKEEVLKETLHSLISNHTEYTYTSSQTDVWDILKQTDRDTINPDNVILIYSGRSVDAAQEYNSAAGWSREHVWAKSRGDFGTSPGPGTDVHHLRPCDVGVNSTRNNRNFDDCVSCVDVIDNGYNTGSKRDASLWTFEPPDEVKGDVARMIFYMAIRYEGTNGEPDLELSVSLLDKSSKLPFQANLNTLLEWNRIDSVSDWERNRNEIIFSDFQGNRNPLIDHPELAEYLWGDSTGLVWYPPFPVSVMDKNKEQGYRVYPNPSSHEVFIQGLFQEAQIFDVNGSQVSQIIGGGNSVNTIYGLNQGVYFVHIINSNGNVSIKKIMVI